LTRAALRADNRAREVRLPPDSARQQLRDASLELARLRRIRGASHRTWRRIARARNRIAVAAALLAAAPLGEPAAAAIPVFEHGFVFPDFVQGAGSHAPTFVDVDGDGDADVFMGDGGGRILFFANTGSASLPRFSAPATHPFGLADVGDNASPTFGDLDGDGDFDALVGSFLGNLFFLQNTGTASAPAFAAPVTNPFGLANVGLSSYPMLGDLDGDGDLDVAIGSNSGDVLFFRNTGTAGAPAFDAPLTNPFGLARVGGSASPELADVDGDGDLDALVGHQGGEVSFFENTGAASDPAFAAPVSSPFGFTDVGSFARAAFADVDADGDLDALLSGVFQGSHFTIAYENVGTAAAPAFDAAGNPFGLTPPAGFPSSSPPSSAAFGDLDGDGDVDALVGPAFGSPPRFLRNTGSATFPAFAPDPPNPFGLVGGEPTLADIDADGDLDVFVGEPAGETVFFANTGSAGAAAFAPGVMHPFGLSAVVLYASPELADIDGDGDLDAFVGSGLGTTDFFQNTGTAASPAFAAPVSNPFGFTSGGFGASPALADLDGDGDLDALLGEASGGLRFFANTGTAAAPAFAPPVTNPFGLFSVGARPTPTFADHDGDGDFDLFVGRGWPATALFVNTGTASAPAFTGAPLDPFGGNEGAYGAPALGDLDGDGDLDALVGRQSEPEMLLVRNFGSGSAANFVSSEAPNPFGLTQGLPRLVDIDADGDLDVFLNQANGDTHFFANTGSTSEPEFGVRLTNPFGLADVIGSGGGLAFADLDADGDFDAFLGNSDGNTFWFRNSGTAAAPAFAAPSSNPFGLADVGVDAAPAFADLDADGDLDACIGNRAGDVLVFVNVGTSSAPAFAAPLTNPFGFQKVGSDADPSLVDIDGDGDLDGLVGEKRGRVFFFQNLATGPAACDDGLDNDGDGRIDFGPGAGTDPGCTSAADPSELGTKQCDNGQDDDGDGKIDFRPNGTGDPQCVGPLDDREAPDPPAPPGGCGLGPELLLLAPLLEAERRRRRRLQRAS
jgi:hypothetical protein